MDNVSGHELNLEDLSNGSILALEALLAASSANGHDFGFMDEARQRLSMSRHKFAGHISALVALGAFYWTEDDPDYGVQFCLTAAVIGQQQRVADYAKAVKENG